MSKKAVVVIDRDWEQQKGHKSNFWLLVTTAALVIVLAGAAYAVYWYSSNAKNIAAYSPEIAELHQQVDFLQKENEKLKLDLAKAQRSIAIDYEAGQMLQQTIMEREVELEKLNEELTFYKSIVDPDNQNKGVSLRRFSLNTGAKDGQYRFRLVVAQSGGKKTTSGTVVIRIQGRLQDDVIKTLGWKDISVGKDSQPAFRFQYFEKLEGVFQLPEGFEPEHILIKLQPRNSKVEASQQSFSWEAALKGDEL